MSQNKSKKPVVLDPRVKVVTHDVIPVFEPLPADKREEAAPPEDDDMLHIVDIDGTDRLVLSWDRGEPYGDGLGAEVHCFRNATTGGWLARGSLVPCGIGDAVLAVVYE